MSPEINTGKDAPQFGVVDLCSSKRLFSEVMSVPRPTTSIIENNWDQLYVREFDFVKNINTVLSTDLKAKFSKDAGRDDKILAVRSKISMDLVLGKKELISAFQEELAIVGMPVKMTKVLRKDYNRVFPGFKTMYPDSYSADFLASSDNQAEVILNYDYASGLLNAGRMVFCEILTPWKANDLKSQADIERALKNNAKAVEAVLKALYKTKGKQLTGHKLIFKLAETEGEKTMSAESSEILPRLQCTHCQTTYTMDPRKAQEIKCPSCGSPEQKFLPKEE